MRIISPSVEVISFGESPFGIKRPAATFEGILDTVTATAWGLFSLERLHVAYSGSAIRVERTDTSQTDIGFLADGSLDVATADAFGSNLSVVTWYDQSGNGRNLTTGVAKRPVLDTSTVSLRFNDSQFNIPSMTALTAAEAFVKVKLDNDPPLTADGGFWTIGNSGTNSHVPNGTNGIVYDDFATNARKTTVNPATSFAGAYVVYGAYSAANDWQNYLNGTSLHSTATNTVAFTASATFGQSVIAGYYLLGNVQSFLLYSHKVTGADRTLINSVL